jgi:Uma2 family endonuclease
MPQKLIRTTYVDDEDDDETDQKIFQPPPRVKLFEPSPATRFARLQLMPPPTSTSTTATRTLSKELKTVVRRKRPVLCLFTSTQITIGESCCGKADSSLYCWTLELHDFPESQLKQEMKLKAIHSVM